MTSVASPSDGRLPWRRLTIAAVWACAVLTAVHPVSTDGLWWELSKGRSLDDGNWNPTAALIAGAVGADAHWLSGILPYLLYALSGASGLMCLKTGSVLALTGWLLGRASQTESTTSWRWIGVTVATALLAARQAWEPAPLFFDTFGLVAVYLATEHIAAKRSFARLTFPLLLLCLWSNFGPRCLAGIPVALCNFYRQPQKPIAGLGFAALLLGACCLTPAGWQTPLNSLSLTVPQAVESSAILTMAGWHPWWEHPTASDAMAFVGLSLVYLLHVRHHRSAGSLFVLVAAHVLAGASSENLPLAAVWIALVATSAPAVAADLPAKTVRAPSLPRGDTSRLSRRDGGADLSQPAQPAWQKLAWAGAMLGIGWAASRPWDGCGSGVGWGLDPRLSPEAFSASLAEASLEGNAHCVGLREAGLLSWHASSGVRPYDTPSTALLSRRLREHVLLTSDLSKGWQIPHRRPDGSWGGWWQVLRARGATALVVPSENLELITALEPTIWKPLSLSAVSLVYGKAGDPGCARQIVDSLSVRQLVDRGVWTYQLSSEESASTVEFLAWFGETSTTYQSLRLARVFRAMQMHVGALKVLHAIPGRPDAERGEFHANQLALGYQERIHCGRSSELRLRASLLSVPRNRTHAAVQQILHWAAVPDAPADDRFVRAVSSYATGDLRAALAGLPGDSPEGLYAQAVLLLESGEPQAAQSRFQELLTTFADHRLSAMARLLSSSLAY